MTPFETRYRRSKPLLGTFVEISLSEVSEDVGIDITNGAFAEVVRLEKIFNFFDSESELSGFNRSSHRQKIQVSDEMNFVLALGSDLESNSQGAFSLSPHCQKAAPHFRHNCSIDLSGIAKGFIVDKVFESISAMAPNLDFIVNAGGDLRVKGSAKVEIRVPTQSKDVRYEIQLKNQAMATSSRLGAFTEVGTAAATYNSNLSFIENQKIIPTTVSVLAKTCVIADSFTKICLFGQKAISLQDRFAIDDLLFFDHCGKLS